MSARRFAEKRPSFPIGYDQLRIPVNTHNWITAQKKTWIRILPRAAEQKLDMGHHALRAYSNACRPFFITRALSWSEYQNMNAHRRMQNKPGSHNNKRIRPVIPLSTYNADLVRRVASPWLSKFETAWRIQRWTNLSCTTTVPRVKHALPIKWISSWGQELH